MAYIPNPDDTLYKGPPPYDSDYGQYCHSRDPASHDSQRGYWVAPDGTRHSLTEDQAQQMLAQTPAQQEFLVSKDPLHKDALSPIQSTRRDLMQRPAPQDVPIQAQLDPLDQEMLAEAQGYETHDQSVQDSDKHDDAALDESLSWIPRFEGRLEEARSNVTLAVPVVIPQTAPGIQSPFSRAWAPILATHGVKPQEFLQFIDHLNVCKAASPPLQLLNLAGTIVGFAPVPFGFAISMGTSAVAAGGQMAVARVRITRYLERANKDYFHPRGLQARIAKQNILPQIVRQPPGAPLLAPIPAAAVDVSSFPSLRDRRMQALGDHVAPLHFEGTGSAPSTENNVLDKISAKMTARKARKTEEKMAEKHMKHREDDMKERQDLAKEEAKIHAKMQKASYKGDRSKVVKLEAELQKEQAKCGEKIGEGGGKEEKAAGKFMFVVVQSLEAASQQQ